VEKRVRTTAGGASGSVRNLRIREDTAKYLLNLDLNSAHYDPKSRSMREDPLPNKPLKDKTFAGDNFVRQNGDYHEWEALTVHAFAAADRGQNIHMQGAPSQVTL
jgi:pre-mRNA-processing factor SLU7